MVAMILLLLKILMSVSWEKMIVITFVKTIQWVVTGANVTKVTSCLVTTEHAKVKKKVERKWYIPVIEVKIIQYTPDRSLGGLLKCSELMFLPHFYVFCDLLLNRQTHGIMESICFIQ